MKNRKMKTSKDQSDLTIFKVTIDAYYKKKKTSILAISVGKGRPIPALQKSHWLHLSARITVLTTALT